VTFFWGNKMKFDSVLVFFSKFFNREPDVFTKLATFREEVVFLNSRSEQHDVDLTKLEEKEAELLQKGKSETSPLAKQRLASKVADVRRAQRRIHTFNRMILTKISVLNTDIHNLSIITEGERIGMMPSSEELTDHAVDAEAMLEELQSDGALVDQLSHDQFEVLIPEDERAILAEFEDEVKTEEVAETEVVDTRIGKPLEEPVKPAPKRKMKEKEAV